MKLCKFTRAMHILTCKAPGCNQNAGTPFKTPNRALNNVVLVLKMQTDTCQPPAVQGGGEADNHGRHVHRQNE